MVSAESSGFLHYLQLARHELATIDINVTKNEIPNSKFRSTGAGNECMYCSYILTHHGYWSSELSHQNRLYQRSNRLISIRLLLNETNIIYRCLFCGNGNWNLMRPPLKLSRLKVNSPVTIPVVKSCHSCPTFASFL